MLENKKGSKLLDEDHKGNNDDDDDEEIEEYIAKQRMKWSK